MIQSNPPRAEARRQARAERSSIVEMERSMNVAHGPNRALRRARPAAPGEGSSPTSNRSDAPRRAARIRQRRRAERLARRAAR